MSAMLSLFTWKSNGDLSELGRLQSIIISASSIEGSTIDQISRFDQQSIPLQPGRLLLVQDDCFICNLVVWNSEIVLNFVSEHIS
jgi:hypothetical protein